VGYFGYESLYLIEEVPDVGVVDLSLPTLCFGLHDMVLACSHVSGEAFLSVIGRGDTAAVARQRALDRRDAWLRRIRALEADPPPETVGSPDHTSPSVRSHFDEPAYCRLVERVKEHIFAGDVFEVCLTHRLEADFAGDPWRLYQELRRLSPAPFACFLNFPDAQVVSSSPERFLRLGPDRIAESRPIKGTRPRGATPEQDEALYRELLCSVKDRAENVMIVDLVRNDFGRVCRFGTVHVPELMAVEKYATVFQMVSTIRGQLDEGRDGLDLVRACFPGGSMTGAPKIEAMKIIDRMEPVKRGIYSGAIGYLDYTGSLDLSIVIRTLVIKDGRAYFHVGGAIVADSDPLDEYHETLIKAQALIAALQRTGDRA
jgi:aminodeoxychorismate synthase component I